VVERLSPALVHVYTGDGKGKSSTAFGLALRAWGHGLRVLIVQFIKHTEYSGEFKAVQRLEGMDLRQFGTGKFLGPERITPEDVAAANDGLRYAGKMLSEGEYDLVILDELNLAIYFGLIKVEDAIEVIKMRKPWVEVVVTGRKAPPEVIEVADYVTEMLEVKHPFSRGIPARKGIEY